MKEYFIDDKLKIAIKKDQEIKDIIDYEDSLLNSIHRARVKKINKNLNFAELILTNGSGFLNLKDAKRGLVEGEDILVQVKSIPKGNKNPKVSMELSLQGDFIVYFPKTAIFKFSNNLSKKNISRLIRISKSKKFQNLLFRTNAKSASEEELVLEYNRLKEIGDRLIIEENLRPSPKLLYEKNLLKDFFKDLKPHDKIITNSESIYKKYKNITSYDPLFSIENSKLIYEYKSLFSRSVKLKNKVEICIDKTESLTAIDVNSSYYNQITNSFDDILNINICAAREAVKQIYLRNISGIIIIDFINMEKSNYDTLLKKFNDFNKEYNNTIKVHGFTSLGLLELSRENKGEGLKNKL